MGCAALTTRPRIRARLRTMKSPHPNEPILLTSFASPGFFGWQRLLHESAIRLGVVTHSRPVRQSELLASDFGKINQELLKQPRGAGYWAWKPHLILEALDQVPLGGWVLYSDVGRWPRILAHSIAPLLCWCVQHHQPFLPGTRIQDIGSALPWTKRECAEFFGYDTETLEQFQQTSATWSLWSNCERSRIFLEEWRNLAIRPGLIDDSPSSRPEWPGYIEHRHDQSLLSCLVQKYNLSVFLDDIMPELDHNKRKNLDLVLSMLDAPKAGEVSLKAAFACIQAALSIEPWTRNHLRSLFHQIRGDTGSKARRFSPPP
jgi:hypothetical protein